MNNLIIVLTFTIVFWIANVAMGKFMLIAIAQDQLFDKLFGWQKMLNSLYGGGTFKQLLGKFLGDCSACFLHLISIVNFLFYVVFLYVGLSRWIIPVDKTSWTFWIVSIIWYFVYVSIGWMLSMKINNDEKTKEA